MCLATHVCVYVCMHIFMYLQTHADSHKHTLTLRHTNSTYLHIIKYVIRIDTQKEVYECVCTRMRIRVCLYVCACFYFVFVYINFIKKFMIKYHFQVTKVCRLDRPYVNVQHTSSLHTYINTH